MSSHSAEWGLTCGPAAARMAGRGLMQPRVCGRWLPVRLPGFSLATLTSEYPEPDAVTGRASRSHATPSPLNPTACTRGIRPLKTRPVAPFQAMGWAAHWNGRYGRQIRLPR